MRCSTSASSEGLSGLTRVIEGKEVREKSAKGDDPGSQSAHQG